MWKKHRSPKHYKDGDIDQKDFGEAQTVCITLRIDRVKSENYKSNMILDYHYTTKEVVVFIHKPRGKCSFSLCLNVPTGLLVKSDWYRLMAFIRMIETINWNLY